MDTTKKAQRRNWPKLSFGGRTLTVRQWAARLKLTEQALYVRLNKYPIELALAAKKMLPDGISCLDGRQKKRASDGRYLPKPAKEVSDE